MNEVINVEMFNGKLRQRTLTIQLNNLEVKFVLKEEEGLSLKFHSDFADGLNIAVWFFQNFNASEIAQIKKAFAARIEKEKKKQLKAFYERVLMFLIIVLSLSY